MKTLEELLSLRRMGENSPYGGCNALEGLFDLIKEINLQDKPMAEIGCWIGVSTQAFLHYKPSKLIAVDCWGMDPRYCEAAGFNPDDADVERQFRATMSEYNNVEIIKNLSVKAAEQVPDKSLYFVYIDACHSYDYVWADINSWLPKIQDGGYIGGHDFCYDVEKAVKDGINILPRLKNKPYKTYKDTSWLIKLD